MRRVVIDLSVPVTSLDTPVYPGLPQPVRSTFATIAETGFQSNVWTFEEHVGTHVDAPAHTVRKGATVDSLPVSDFVLQGAVLDFTRKPPKYLIRASDIKSSLGSMLSRVGRGWILLFFTGYTKKGGKGDWLDNPALSTDACDFIAELRVNAVGIDAASPDREPFPAHTILLPRGVALYENLSNLHKLIGREFIFVGVPLRLTAGTASPVRAIALLLRGANSLLAS